ncbi:SMI1/KNR4 family protein [Rathayibacter soli]|uniref:hypothetical protein n=1 Tax=Rathayibacter soli TaxID=3144168 RepID=UPI0027E5B8A7|nr:hypothetical protein [Glaciibacter superstes]
MAANDVTVALERYEAALRNLGAPVVANLRPGISPREALELEAQYDVKLPDEARAVWEWHNGVDGARGSYGGDPLRYLTPPCAFGDLGWSLEFAHEFIGIVEGTNPTSGFSSRKFVSLLIGNLGYVINLTPGQPPLTYMNDPMSWSLADYPSMPIAEQVDWWTWALETGAWQIDEAGRWHADFARYPQDGLRHVLL